MVYDHNNVHVLNYLMYTYKLSENSLSGYHNARLAAVNDLSFSPYGAPSVISLMSEKKVNFA